MEKIGILKPGDIVKLKNHGYHYIVLEKLKTRIYDEQYKCLNLEHLMICRSMNISQNCKHLKKIEISELWKG